MKTTYKYYIVAWLNPAHTSRPTLRTFGDTEKVIGGRAYNPGGFYDAAAGDCNGTDVIKVPKGEAEETEKVIRESGAAGYLEQIPYQTAQKIARFNAKGNRPGPQKVTIASGRYYNNAPTLCYYNNAIGIPVWDTTKPAKEVIFKTLKPYK